MYRIDYEEYWNDFFRKQHQKTFASLSDIEEWVFGQMQRDYRGDNLVMYFPQGDQPSRIEFHPVRGGASFWIYMIQSNDGIVFSDGKLTCGQKYASERVREWLKHCKERRDKPAFCFAQ